MVPVGRPMAVLLLVFLCQAYGSILVRLSFRPRALGRVCRAAVVPDLTETPQPIESSNNSCAANVFFNEAVPGAIMY